MNESRIKLVVFLTGKSTAGKTTIAVEVAKRFNSTVIHTDSLYALKGNEDVSIGEEGNKKEQFVKSHPNSEIVIVEGSHVGNSREIEIFKRLLEPEKSVVITLESKEFEQRFQKKYGDRSRENYTIWYDSFYDMEEYSLCAETVEEVFNIIQKTMEDNIYVYQDQIKVEEKLKNLNYNWEGKSVFEIGCNVGRLGDFLRDKLTSYVGVDVKEDMIEIGKQRYGLDLITGDALDYLHIQKDILVSLAVYHHMPDESVRRIFRECKCNEMIFEVPIGDTPNYTKYHLRSKEWYESLVKELYGEVVEIVDSGARNDPINKRIIFICRKLPNNEKGSHNTEL